MFGSLNGQLAAGVEVDDLGHAVKRAAVLAQDVLVLLRPGQLHVHEALAAPRGHKETHVQHTHTHTHTHKSRSFQDNYSQFKGKCRSAACTCLDALCCWLPTELHGALEPGLPPPALMCNHYGGGGGGGVGANG